MRIGLFIPCYIDAFFPDVGIATLELLERFGHDVAFASSQGNFQLNVYNPVMLHNVMESTQLLTDACLSFEARCARGIEPNEKRIAEHLENSLMLVTALNPHIGYEKAARISLTAYREELSMRQAALKPGFLTHSSTNGCGRRT